MSRKEAELDSKEVTDAFRSGWSTCRYGSGQEAAYLQGRTYPLDKDCWACLEDQSVWEEVESPV